MKVMKPGRRDITGGQWLTFTNAFNAFVNRTDATLARIEAAVNAQNTPPTP